MPYFDRHEELSMPAALEARRVLERLERCRCMLCWPYGASACKEAAVSINML